MKVLTSEPVNEIVIKNSRFIAEVFTVTSQAEARQKLHDQKVKYADAKHVVHAFVCGKSGEVSGMSDDGEPSGTAGRPVLDVLKGSGITNILLTVTRYFGGVLLGTGGLVQAYQGSAKNILELCTTEELVEKVSFSMELTYSEYGDVKHILEDYDVSSLTEDFGENVILSAVIPASQSDSLGPKIKNLTKGRLEVSFSCI